MFLSFTCLTLSSCDSQHNLIEFQGFPFLFSFLNFIMIILSLCTLWMSSRNALINNQIKEVFICILGNLVLLLTFKYSQILFISWINFTGLLNIVKKLWSNSTPSIKLMKDPTVSSINVCCTFSIHSMWIHSIT